MGRLTEIIAFLNASPDELQDMKQSKLFQHFDVYSDDAKEFRKDHLRIQRAQEREANIKRNSNLKLDL